MARKTSQADCINRTNVQTGLEILEGLVHHCNA